MPSEDFPGVNARQRRQCGELQGKYPPGVHGAVTAIAACWAVSGREQQLACRSSSAVPEQEGQQASWSALPQKPLQATQHQAAFRARHVIMLRTNDMAQMPGASTHIVEAAAEHRDERALELAGRSMTQASLSKMEGARLSQGIASADHVRLWNASVGGCLGRGQLLRTLQHLRASVESVKTHADLRR